MSIAFIEAVFNLSPYRAETLLVQLACADWANPQGIFYPSVDEIALKARITKRGAIGILRVLKSDGAIVQLNSNRGGRGHRNSYQFGKDYLDAVAHIRQEWEAKREEIKGESLSPFKTKGERPSPFNKKIKGEPESLKGERDDISKENRHEPSCMNRTLINSFPAAKAEKNGSEIFKIPTLTEFTQEIFDNRLQAWLEKNAPSIMPAVATSAFLDYHQSEKTQFKDKTAFLYAWRGWIRNAEKFTQTKASRKDQSHDGQSHDGPGTQKGIDWKGLKAAGII